MTVRKLRASIARLLAPRSGGQARGRFISVWVSFGLLALLFAAVSQPAFGADAPARILVIFSNNSDWPANVAVGQGLRTALDNVPGRQITVFDEFLDHPQFAGEDQERRFAAFVREKYAALPPDVIVVGGDEAMSFILRHRAALFADRPVVHMGVTQGSLTTASSLPTGFAGIPWDLDFAGTIEAALRMHPQARRLTIVTGASARERQWEAMLRTSAFDPFRGRVQVDFLPALPNSAVLERLGRLGRQDLVFLVGYFQDADGTSVTPRETAERMASASTAPVYAPFATFVGTGIVGGVATPFEEIGQRAGQIAIRLIEGDRPDSLNLPEKMPTRMFVDWRQVQRWGIDPAMLPPDAVVRFREPTLLESNPNAVMIAIAVIVIQSGLIGWLIFENRRRRVAELAIHAQRRELAHASRLAVAAELTGSIAHEINQPLGAIASNADAAELILDSGGDRRDELRAILADIRRDDLRASEVIRRLRDLLTKSVTERAPVDINGIVRDVATFLAVDARRRAVGIVVQLAAEPAVVVGDRIELQQIVINLALNAMDAMANQPEERRKLVMAIQQTNGVVATEVRDQGPGIAAEHLPKLFDSFFTTKREGMGLGLSIVRSLVETHGGRILVENLDGGGAMFRVELPAAVGGDGRFPG